MNDTPEGRRLTLQPASPAPADPVQSDDEIDLGALFGALWRGKSIIIALTCLAILAGGYYAYVVAVPVYKSTATVILDTNQEKIAGLDSIVGGISGDISEVNSEVEVLRARSLMGKVVDRLQLVEDPEFNVALNPPSLINRIKTMIGIGQATATISAEEQALRTRDAVITSLLQKVGIQNVRQSFVFNVAVETTDPRKSKLMADTIVEIYILNQIEVKFEAAEQATAWLTDRVAKLQVDLERAETAVSEFSTSTELVSVEALQGLERQIKDIRDRSKSTDESRIAIAARLEALTSADTREAQAALANDAQLDQFLRRIDEGDLMETAFDTRLQSLLSRLELDLSRAEQQFQALENSEQELAEQIDQQGQDLIQLQQLTREAEATHLLYEHFLTRLKETSAQQGVQQADSRILSQGVIPNSPSAPRKSMIVVLSAILGIMSGAGLVILREMRNTSFRTAREIETHTGYTVMGQVPTIPAKARTKVLNYLSEKPTSAAAEAVRNLRTSVLLSNVDSPPQVIVLTSSFPGEGKTTVALALAHNLLGLGKSVLLLEGDIRSRTLHQYFENVPSKGIVSVLSGDVDFDEALFQPKEFGGDMLPGEKSSANAADLFASDKFGDLITDLRKRYDVIIIDTPPVLVVPDAQIIAQQADAVLFTVKWDSTSQTQVDESLRLFHNSNQRISGVVLNQISPKGMKRYGYGGKYGAYGAYGSKYYTS